MTAAQVRAELLVAARRGVREWLESLADGRVSRGALLDAEVRPEAQSPPGTLVVAAVAGGRRRVFSVAVKEVG